MGEIESVEYKLSEVGSNFINFLRAISSQFVLIGHALALNKLVSYATMRDLPSFSVLIFFVLSGYVIAYSTSFKGKLYGFKNYFIDRFARIYITLLPALIIILLIAIVFYFFNHSFPFNISWKYFLSTLLMQQENQLLLQAQYLFPNSEEYKFVGMFGNNLPLWSLSIEWWHYMFFGLLYYTGFKKMSFGHIILFLFSITFVLGYAFFPGRAGNGLSFIWFSGVLIHYLLRSKIDLKKPGLLALVFLAATIFGVIVASPVAILFFIFFFFCALVYFNQFHLQPNRLNAFFLMFKWPSNYSFSIYIIHYPIILVCLYFIKNPILNCFVSFVVSNIIALFSYYFFERNHKIIAKKLKKE